MRQLKTCAQCKSENEDGAKVCAHCGQQAFIEREADLEELKPGFNGRNLFYRILVAITIGLLISGISIYVAWQNASDSEDFRWEQNLTRMDLESINKSVAEYKKRFSVAPKTFDDLTNVFSESVEMPHPLDSWRHLIVFSTNSGNFVATSFGRDGKPGGVGLDFDLTTENPWPKEARPTFKQFLQEPPAHRMLQGCYICGALAGLMSFFIIKLRRLTRSRLIWLLLEMTVMVIVTLFMASIIAAFHIPVHEH